MPFEPHFLKTELDVTDEALSPHLDEEGKINTYSSISRRAEAWEAAYRFIKPDQETAVPISKPPLLTPDNEHTQANLRQERNYKNQIVEALAQTTRQPVTAANRALEEAEYLNSWAEKRKVDYTQYTAQNKTTLLAEQPIYKLTPELIQDYLALLSDNKPVWAQKLPGGAWELEHLIQKVRDAQQAAREASGNTAGDQINNPTYQKAFAEKLGTLSCTRRQLPGLSNFSKHYAYYEKGDTAYKAPPVLRASTPVPIHVKNKALRDEITRKNIEQFIANSENPDKLPYLITSLMAPIGVGALGNNDKMIMDSIQRVVKKMNVERTSQGQPKIIYVNHAINHPVLRTFSRGGDQAKKASQDILRLTARTRLQKTLGESGNNLVAHLDRWLQKGSEKNYTGFINEAETLMRSLNEKLTSAKPGEEKNKVLEQLLLVNAVKDYVQLLQHKPFAGANKNPNLFLAALEQIISPNCIGVCISGKDRTGCLLIQRDSMLEAFYTNPEHRLANYFDPPEQRATFVSSFTRNLASNHQGNNAALNAPGCNGQKNLTHMLARDQREKMNTDYPGYLKSNKAVAGMNRQAHGRYKQPKDTKPSAEQQSASDVLPDQAPPEQEQHHFPPPELEASPELQAHVTALTKAGIKQEEAVALISELTDKKTGLSYEQLDTEIQEKKTESPDKAVNEIYKDISANLDRIRGKYIAIAYAGGKERLAAYHADANADVATPSEPAASTPPRPTSTPNPRRL